MSHHTMDTHDTHQNAITITKISSNPVLQPYVDALVSTMNSNSSSSTTTTNHSNHNSQYTVQRAIMIKILQDPDIYYGYNEMKQLVLYIWDHHQQQQQQSCHMILDDDQQKLLHTFDLFSYGTLSDYISNTKIIVDTDTRSSVNSLSSSMDVQHDAKQEESSLSSSSSYYIHLSEIQLTKLKQLTILSIIHQSIQQPQPQPQNIPSPNHQFHHNNSNIVPYHIMYNAINITATSTTTTASLNEKDQNSTTGTSTIISSSISSPLDDTSMMIRTIEQLLLPMMAAHILVGKLSHQHLAFIVGIGRTHTNTSNNHNSILSSQLNHSEQPSTISHLSVVQSRDVAIETIPHMIQSIQHLQMNISNQSNSKMMQPSIARTTTSPSSSSSVQPPSVFAKALDPIDHHHRTILIHQQQQHPSQVHFDPMIVEEDDTTIKPTQQQSTSTTTTTTTTATTTTSTTMANTAKRSRDGIH